MDNQTGVKYIIWGVLGIIAILVAVKQLGFNPTKVTTGPVSVELSGGIAPKTQSQGETPPPEDAARLETRVRELENQLHATPAQAVAPANAGAAQTSVEESQPPNVGGTWQSGGFTVRIAQQGASVVTRTFLYGALSSAGQGTLTGRNLRVTYTNYLGVPGRFEAAVSADGAQMTGADYGSGYPVPFTLIRTR